MRAMSDPGESLANAARQLIEIEQLIGGQYVPKGANPLPEIELSAKPPAGD